MRSNVTSEVGIGTRFSDWWRSMPVMTSGVLALCVSVYVIGLLIGFDTYSKVCVAPNLLFSPYWQLYRALTGVIFHAGVLHIALNMMTFVPMGSGLERLLGSVRYVYSLFLFAITNSLIHGALAYAIALNPVYPYPAMLYECSIGFSGILFAMIVTETHLSGATHRNIFGLFNVPAKLYPWVLLALFQFLMPNVSILGHLSGLLSGLAYITGLFSILSLPSSFISAIENSFLLAPLVRKPTFIVGGSNVMMSSGLPSMASPRSSSHDGYGLGISGLWRSMQGWTRLPSRAAATEEEEAGANGGGHRPATGSGPFAGRGRTLGSSAVAPPHRWGAGQGLLAANQAGTGGTNRNPAVTGGGGFLGPTGTGTGIGVPVQSNSGGGEAGIVHAAILAGSAQSALQADHSGDGGVKMDALSQLVSMGYEASAARSALLAANGDVALAVEFLSP